MTETIIFFKKREVIGKINPLLILLGLAWLLVFVTTVPNKSTGYDRIPKLQLSDLNLYYFTISLYADFLVHEFSLWNTLFL